MPIEIEECASYDVEFLQNPENYVPEIERTYDENTLEERIDQVLNANPERADRATEHQSAFRNLCRKIFNGREGRWPTPQIQVELSRRLAGPKILNGFR